MTQLFKIIDRSVSFALKMFSVNFCTAAINFLLLKNVARVQSSRRLSERKKKKYGDHRRYGEGEKPQSSHRGTSKSGGGKVLHSYSGLLNNVISLSLPPVPSFPLLPL